MNHELATIIAAAQLAYGAAVAVDKIIKTASKRKALPAAVARSSCPARFISADALASVFTFLVRKPTHC